MTGRPARLATVSVVPAGHDAFLPYPGDLLAVHRRGPVRSLIRAGQWARPALRPWAEITHIACVVDKDGTIVEAVFPRVREAHASYYRESDYFHVRTHMDDHDAAQAVRYLYEQIDEPYAVGACAGTALRLLTPGRGLWFERTGTNMCSGMAAQALERGEYVWPFVGASMCPAEVVRELGVPKHVSRALRPA